jgi:surfeit locus 1 family protein
MGSSTKSQSDPAKTAPDTRDVSAIAAARGLSKVAPYFIDAEAAEVPNAWPRGGMTVGTFTNIHLVYAMTWFGLAFVFFGAAVFAQSERWPRRKTI